MLIWPVGNNLAALVTSPAKVIAIRRPLRQQESHELPAGPNELWVADIAYIAIATGFVYLAPILDAWSRRVAGYAVKARFTGSKFAQICGDETPRAEPLLGEAQSPRRRRGARRLVQHSSWNRHWTLAPTRSPLGLRLLDNLGCVLNCVVARPAPSLQSTRARFPHPPERTEP
jgi:hypothetical protein